MSLLSLRKSTPSADVRSVSVERFIDEALDYSAGRGAHPDDENVTLLPVPSIQDDTSTPHWNRGMRRATFTLDDATIQTLSSLSEQTGISRSRLIRIWASEQAVRDSENLVYATTP